MRIQLGDGRSRSADIAGLQHAEHAVEAFDVLGEVVVAAGVRVEAPRVEPCFQGCDRAVIVDAVRAGAGVGTVHRLAGSDLEQPGGELSLHDLGIPSLLGALAAVLQEPPEIVVIGAEVGDISPFTDRLSPPLEAAVPEAVRLIIHETGR